MLHPDSSSDNIILYVHGTFSKPEIDIGSIIWGFSGGSEVKASASNAGDPGSIPGSGRCPGNGNPLQYSYLENSMDRRAWQATVMGLQSCVLKSDTTE